jgi:hypothetical protein
MPEAPHAATPASDGLCLDCFYIGRKASSIQATLFGFSGIKSKIASRKSMELRIKMINQNIYSLCMFFYSVFYM